jgi:hypothetical protein
MVTLAIQTRSLAVSMIGLLFFEGDILLMKSREDAGEFDGYE